MLFEKYDPQTLEPQILEYWQQKRIVEKLRERDKKNKKFYFLQGPPYTSGKIHLGHAWNMALKDIILRYKRMLGYNVWDRMGYDMHGLPTEQKVMKKFNLKNKEDILKFGLAEFMKECHKFCVEMMEQMNEDFQRLGSTLDYTDPYQPIANSFMEAEWLLIKTAQEKGRLYQGLRTMPWDAATQTAAAKHELEYKQIKDISIYVKFPLADDQSKYFIVWTTTPWTIPLNLAIMVNPELHYAEVKVGKEIWIVAEPLLEAVMSKAKIEKYSVKEKHQGRKLAGLKYRHPLNIKQYLPETLQKNPRLFTVLLSSEYVDASSGTGLVHCAPGCGPEDYEVGHLNHLPPFNCVNEEGYFENFGPYNGWKAKTDDDKFIAALKEAGALIAEESYIHDYPHGERSHEPVIFRTTKQWFFKVEDLKEKMLEANQKIYWNPAAAKNAFNSWLENLRDNSITKQRYWGTPVPIWQAGEGDYLVVGSLAELERLSGKKVINMHLPDIDKVIIKKNDKIYRRIPDVLDVWIDAGTVSWNCLDYPQNKENFARYFPADFILEGKDQIRGWFNLLMIASFLALDKPSFKNVFMHGFLNDINGVKMSKSLGNIIPPDEIIDQHGADALRYYMCQTAAGEDINFSWDECLVKERQLHILWNIHKLLLNLVAETKIKPQKISLPTLGAEEKYILSRLHSTIKLITRLLEEYRLDEIVQPIEDLFLELSRAYIQIARDKSALGTDEEKKQCLYTIYTVLLETLKMLQLIAPFISEAIYLNLKEELKLSELSLSHFKWPEANDKLIDPELEKSMEMAREIITAALNAREKIKRNLRWPVQEIIIVSQNPEAKKAVKNLQGILKSQINAKTIAVKESLPGVVAAITANPSKIGPAYGALSPKIMAEINQNSEPVAAELQKNHCYNFVLNKTKIVVTREMVNISRTVPEGYCEAEGSFGLVYLNKNISAELDREGFARELIRNIQQLRKNQGLQKTDRIKLQVKTNLNLQPWVKEIKEKVGAKHILISNEKGTGAVSETFKIKEEEFAVWLSKAVK